MEAMIPLATDLFNYDPIQILPNGKVLLDYGPMHIFIHVFEDGRPLLNLAREGALFAIKLLEELAGFLPVIKNKAERLEALGDYPEVVRRMIEATKRMQEPDLTPLSAVAGTISELVAENLFKKGGTKIIIDNGGDIAIRLREGEVARVGIKTEIDAISPSYLVTIDSKMGIEGVATSGLGGRSFTKGIASAVTVLSERASVADASATVIGNHTNVEDPNIIRSFAEEIYPDTDIKGELVTLKVGRLSREKVVEALENGLSKAKSMFEKGWIRGALIAIKEEVIWTDSLNQYLTKL